LVVGLGFVYSLVTTAFSVLAIRKVEGTLVTPVATKAPAIGKGVGIAKRKVSIQGEE